MRNAFGLMIVLLVTGNTAGLAQHWPHWRGPTHDGVSAEKGLPDTWSATCAATPGTVRAKMKPVSSILQIQSTPPTTLYARNEGYCMRPTPATTGAHVRTMGINRAIMMVFPPCFS